MLRPSGEENSRLSSTRLVTDAAGTEVENTDYLPFGEEIDVSMGDARYNIAAYGESGLLRHKFTGKERDTESGMDYFLARYYSGPMGRFLSVDPNNADATLDDPRSWNAYAYVRNNPLIFLDPDGRRVMFMNDRLKQNFRDIGSASKSFETEIAEEQRDNGIIVVVSEKGLEDNVEGSGGHAKIGPTEDGVIIVRIKVDSRRTSDSTIAHEVGHARDARINYEQFQKDAQKSDDEQGSAIGDEHPDRPEEQRADDFRDLVNKEIKEARRRDKQERNFIKTLEKERREDDEDEQ